LAGLLVLLYLLAHNKQVVSAPRPADAATPSTNHDELWVVDAAAFRAERTGLGRDAAVDATTGNYWTAVLVSSKLDPAGVLVRDGATDIAVGMVPLAGTNGYCPGAIALDATNRVAWIAAQCGHSNDPIWAFNADTHTKINGPIGCGGVNGSGAVNPATGRYYHLVSGSVPQRVDPHTFALTTTAFGQVIGVNASANILYAQGPNGTLQIIDGAPDPERILTNVTLAFAFHSDSIGIDPVRNRIYIPNRTSNEILILDGTTGQSRGTVLLDKKYGSIDGVHGVAFDAARNVLYAIAWSEGGRYSFLYAVHDASQRALQIPGGAGGPVLNPRFNKVYIWAGPATVD
jgi:DNA-binding beta-propeller fold protein YncE